VGWLLFLTSWLECPTKITALVETWSVGLGEAVAEAEAEEEEEVTCGPSEDCTGVTSVNNSCPGTAMGHVTSCGCQEYSPWRSSSS